MAPVMSRSTRPTRASVPPSRLAAAAAQRRFETAAPTRDEATRDERTRAAPQRCDSPMPRAPGPRSGRGLGLDADPGAPALEKGAADRAAEQDPRLRERDGARRMAWVVLTIKRLT